MPETEPTIQKPLWETVRNPMTRLVMAAFTEGIGDDPNQMEPREYLDLVNDIYPMEGGQPQASLRVGTWGARNVLIQRMDEVKSDQLRYMTNRLAELAGGDDTSRAAASRIKEVIGTRDRGDAAPLIKLLASQAVARYESTT